MRSTLVLTVVLKKSTSTSISSVARPMTLPVPDSYESSMRRSMEAEMSPRTSTSPRMRRYPVSVTASSTILK